MLRKLRNRIKGQSTAEYAILIALVVAAVIAMQTYAKRALQARMRDASGYLVRTTNELGNSAQYEPYYLQTNFAVTRAEDRAQVLGNGIVGYNGVSNISRDSGGFQQFDYNSSSINQTP